MPSPTRISRNPPKTESLSFLPQPGVFCGPRHWAHERRVPLLFWISCEMWKKKKNYSNSMAVNHLEFEVTRTFPQQSETWSLIQNVNRSLRMATLIPAAPWWCLSSGQVLRPLLFWELEAEGATRIPSESRSLEFVLLTELFGRCSNILGQTDLIGVSFQGHCTYSAFIFRG